MLLLRLEFGPSPDLLAGIWKCSERSITSALDPGGLEMHDPSPRETNQNR
jgi:hypothetical protein